MEESRRTRGPKISSLILMAVVLLLFAFSLAILPIIIGYQVCADDYQFLLLLSLLSTYFAALMILLLWHTFWLAELLEKIAGVEEALALGGDEGGGE